jgi:tetratricopeptide (TPR) repeat protein/transcriptional regulator with XRE-family HTH domain
VSESPVTFAGVLREMRAEANLTQEELAEAALLSVRSVSDLERGVNRTARRETARLLADALRLTGAARERFEAIARGHPVPAAPQWPAVDAAVPSAPAPRMLPRDIGSFIGRERELDELVAAAADTGGLVGIHAVGGMAGVGKTAFAIRAAHLLAERFPDGQLFLPLHGHSPGQPPVEPGEALASLLLMIGVPPGQIPASAEERGACWRDRLAGKRMLVVLDDVTGSSHVAPLLPGDGGCLTLITSRRRLSALDDAATISLDTLLPSEAGHLFTRLVGRPELSPADPLVEEITSLCGYLPLAIGLVASRLQHHPYWPLSDLAAELVASQDPLELMAAENLSVAVALTLSYADLTPAQQRLFRRLGGGLGADIDAYAAAALSDTGLSAARRALEALYDHYLLTEPVYGRYRMHDLIRGHARTLAERLDPADERERATARLLDYYQHTAVRAQAFLAGHIGRTPGAAAAGPAATVPALRTRDQALAWARTERVNLLAGLDHAAKTGQRARLIAMTAGIAGLLRRDGPWAEAIHCHARASRAATDLGDRSGQAAALDELGYIRLLMGDYPGAATALAEALDIVRETGDRYGQAWVLDHVGEMRRMTGDYPGAISAFEESLDIFHDTADRYGRANALAYLGDVRRLGGDYGQAAAALEEALGILRELGDRAAQATPLTFLAELRRMTGDYPAAAEVLEQALTIYRDNGNQRGQAHCLGYRAELWRIAGNYEDAAQALAEALTIYQDAGDRRGVANTHLMAGRLRRITGDRAGAEQDLAEALLIYQDIGDPGGEAEALNEAGTARLAQGDLRPAEDYHRQALALARRIGSRWDEASALAGLGRCAFAVGDPANGETRLAQALTIFRQIGAAAEASAVAAEIVGVTDD